MTDSNDLKLNVPNLLENQNKIDLIKYYDTNILEADKISDENIILRSISNEQELKLESELDAKLNNPEMSPTYLPHEFPKLPENFDDEDVPRSYKCNSQYETKCLEYLENFMRQYKILYRDRKPLILCPKNEYNMKKYICTFLKPINLSFSEMSDWSDIASFVSDFLDYVPLIPSTDIPNKIISSTNVLKCHKGTSFEFAILLCSLLLGVGYDSYVVVGYATRECCLMDLSRIDCPYLKKTDSTDLNINQNKSQKYLVKPLKDLKSKYQLYKEAKIIKDNELERKRLEKEKEIEDKLKLKPLKDPLFGLRIHCWILIKKGLRDVKNDFFIESTSGFLEPLKTDMYVGIENIFNNEEHWINMQDCSEGINELKYNFEDFSKWEPVLPTNKVKQILKSQKHIKLSYNSDRRESLFKNNTDNEDDESDSYDILTTIDAPNSWLKRIQIDKSTYLKRFPNKIKTYYFYKTIVQKCTPLTQIDGLYLRIQIFEDYNMLEKLEVLEYYKQRKDKLNCVSVGKKWTVEYFNPGRMHDVAEHHYKTEVPESQNEHIFLFNNITRLDGLVKRHQTQISLEEWYKNRLDNLIYLCCSFGKPSLIVNEKQRYKVIIKIIKQFQRNFILIPSEDIQEIIFFIEEGRIFITYHTSEFDIISNTREFIKPAILNDGKNTVPYFNDTHNSFEALTGNNYKSNLQLYQILLGLLDEEKKTINIIRTNEFETLEIIKYINHDKKSNLLTLSLYDTIHNIEAHEKRIELEKVIEMELKKEFEEKLDYLSPFLLQFNVNEIETKEMAIKLRESSLNYIKQSLIAKADIIQFRYVSEMEILQKCHQWFLLNQGNTNKDELNKNMNLCKKTIFRLNILENIKLKQNRSAPLKYTEMESRIRKDPRFQKYFTA